MSNKKFTFLQECLELLHEEDDYGFSLEDDESNALSPELIKQYQELAKAEYNAGGRVEINTTANYISLELSNGEEFFAQGHEADEWLAEVPDELSPEEWFLAKEW